MQKRECSDCGGELVLAVRGNQAPTSRAPSPVSPSLLTPGLASSSLASSTLVTSAVTSWRCGTCGSAFSAAQLREDKRGRLKAARA
jgi:ribosomal protein S27AE